MRMAAGESRFNAVVLDALGQEGFEEDCVATSAATAPVVTVALHLWHNERALVPKHVAICLGVSTVGQNPLQVLG